MCVDIVEEVCIGFIVGRVRARGVAAIRNDSFVNGCDKLQCSVDEVAKARNVCIYGISVALVH